MHIPGRRFFRIIFFIFFCSGSGFSVLGAISVVLFVVVRSVKVGCDGDGGAEPTVGASISVTESMVAIVLQAFTI